MGFSIETSVSVFTVFIQGLLSFFSPCIFPLVPLYVGYLSGGARDYDKDGNIIYPRKKVMINTFFFILGVSFAFFLLGFGFTTLGGFFSDHRIWFARISGVIMILFGLYQFGIFGQSKALGQEHRLPFLLNRYAMGPLPALVLGFTFSFAWTPCVGPVLGSVLLMAGSSESAERGFLLIGIYTLGFVVPFIAVGLFTGAVLDVFKKYRKVVAYTVKIGAVLLILMGGMTLTGFMNGVTSYLSGTDSLQETAPIEEEETEAVRESESEPEKIPALDFTLKDQYGKEHTLSEYKGKTVFLNFWATWCSPCRKEMPEIQALYEKYGKNEEDLIVIGMAAPNIGQEGDAEHIKKFLEDNHYTFPVLIDEDATNFMTYGIRAFPTTFMIDVDGNIYGYVESALTADMMESIVEQTMNQEERN